MSLCRYRCPGIALSFSNNELFSLTVYMNIDLLKIQIATVLYKAKSLRARAHGAGAYLRFL